jgi:hypothetical protein
MQSTTHGVRIPVGQQWGGQAYQFRSRVLGSESGRRVLSRPVRPKCQIVRRHIDSHREQNEGRGYPKERAVVHPLPMKAMHQVWSAVLLKLGIIHRAGDLCEKFIGHLQQAILATRRISYHMTVG